MNLLVVSSHRSHEVSEPLDTIDASYSIIVVDHPGSILSRSWAVFETVRRSIKHQSPDVILVDEYETIGFIVSTLGFWYDIPVVFRLVGDRWKEYGSDIIPSTRRAGLYGLWLKHRLSFALTRFVFNRADGFIVVSEELERLVPSRTGCSPSRVKTVHVPILEPLRDTGNAAAGRSTFDISEDRVILTVTNLEYRGKFEGVRTILEEVYPILKHNDDVAYVVAGGGLHYESLEREVATGSSSVADQIYTPGFVDDIADLYALAEVFVYVSYIDGYPNVVIEAQSAELPVIANDDHGMVEQIDHWETGVLVDPSKDGELRRYLEQLLDDRTERDRLGRNAYDRVNYENGPAVIGRHLERAITDILRNLEA